jgi:hypothetical protein
VASPPPSPPQINESCKRVHEFMKAPLKAIILIALLKNQLKVSKKFLVIFCDVHIYKL